MRIAALVLLAGPVSMALAGNIGKPMLIAAEVRFGEKGPFRLLVDTGAETTIVEPELAAEVGIEPQFRVELVNVHGSRLVPGARVKGIAVQGVAVPEAEMLIGQVDEARAKDRSIRGVLGANILRSFDFALEPGAGRLIAGAARPDGAAVPFVPGNGRMVIKGRMGHEVLSFVLDSGSSHVVLFRVPAAMEKTKPVASTVRTLDGVASAAPALWTRDIVFGDGLRIGTLPAAVVPQSGRDVDGLFPAAAFSRVFVDQARRELVVMPLTPPSANR